MDMTATGYVPSNLIVQSRRADPGERTDLTDSTLIPLNIKSVGVVPATRTTSGVFQGQPMERSISGAISDWESTRRLALMDAVAGADLLGAARTVDAESLPRTGTSRLTFLGPATDGATRQRYAISMSALKREHGDVHRQLVSYLDAAALS